MGSGSDVTKLIYLFSDIKGYILTICQISQA